MDCEKIKELLSTYIDGELDAAGTEYVASHIAKCQHCEAEYKSLQNLRRLVQQYGTVPSPPEMMDELRSRLAEESRKVSPLAARPKRRFHIGMGWMGLAASFILLVAGGLYLNIIHREQQTGLLTPTIKQERKIKVAPPVLKVTEKAATTPKTPTLKESMKTREKATASNKPKSVPVVQKRAPVREKQNAPEPTENRVIADLGGQKEISPAPQETEEKVETAGAGEKEIQPPTSIVKEETPAKPAPQPASVMKNKAAKVMEPVVLEDKKATTKEFIKGVSAIQPAPKYEVSGKGEAAKAVLHPEEDMVKTASVAETEKEKKEKQWTGEAIEIHTPEIVEWKKQVKGILGEIYGKETAKHIEKRGNEWRIKAEGKEMGDIMKRLTGARTANTRIVHLRRAEKIVVAVAGQPATLPPAGYLIIRFIKVTDEKAKE